ncbi:MAG: sodium-translocating pyrophosphatase [Clostridia bacterium]|nr:sodium-translocating pyrophosphatase [Clostridia bacterium]
MTINTVVLILVAVGAVGALGYALYNFFSVKKMEEGSVLMQETAQAIRIGAGAFISYEFKIILIVGIAVAILLGVLISPTTACAFLIGATMSELAGFIGMKIATYANVRVANEANNTRHLGKTLKVAFKGGSVMGLCVGGFALLGMLIVFLIFGFGFGQIEQLLGEITPNWIGIEASFSMTISGYALGCSLIAMFNRVGGGIYTKAADMGADLVGKTEAHIPEDDPRNPATIADNVGDNVGDVAGLGSDLLESYVAAVMSTSILACEIFRNSNTPISETLFRTMLIFPLGFAALGILACVIGIASLLLRNKLSDNPHKELNMATWVAAGCSILFGGIFTFLAFRDFTPADFEAANFRAGAFSPWIAAAIGIVSGIVIGVFAEYYTSYDYKPTKNISHASKDGPALTITQGLALGMKSSLLPVAVLAVAIYVSWLIGGMYGVGMAALGMLSFVSATVAVDTYGPISDNAGGIAEMCGLDKDVRKITDQLDSVGNTTAAIGKGFAIGSAALAALSMMSSYIYSYADASSDLLLNIVDPLVLAGALVGAALPYLFSGMLIEAVAKAAQQMVEEVRRQFKEIDGLLEGKAKPDYKTCIEISSKGALSEMKAPAIISIITPLVCGFVFGPTFVGGLLIGATMSAVMLAIFTGNSGGAWDNGKKFIEVGGVEGEGKGSPAHDAAVVGDTVGDPLKDTVGPSLDILIKIMNVVCVVFIALFSKFNLLSLLG